MDEDLRKTVIIGSGPAGLTAAIYACRADLNPLLFSGSGFGGQLMLTSEVENFPGFPEPILGPELMDRMMKQAERLGTEIVREDVTEVDFRNYPFRIKSFSMNVKALSVIIATGATPRRLNLESEKRLMGKGVSNCAVCDAFFFKGKDVAVVGGGDTAMEEATYLAKFANSVRVIHRRDRLRASAALQKEAFENKKITFIWNSIVAEILGENKVEGLVLKNVVNGETTTIKVDGLFVAIGYEPNTSLFRGQIELDEKGYIVVRNETETSVHGVFAAGDVKDYRYRQAVTAAADGCKAALDADKFLKTREEYISQLRV
jgi:thioredoxin reductase (NADPH)